MNATASATTCKRDGRGLRPGSDAHTTLRHIATGAAPMHARHLLTALNEHRATSDRRARDAIDFRRNVLAVLHARGAVRLVAPQTWAASDAGMAILAELGEEFARGARAAAVPLPLQRPVDAPLLTGRGIHRAPMSHTELAGAPERAGARDYLKHPSRRGNRLYYHDGRVTDLQGNPIASEAAAP